ncbi:MAG: spore cortex biosynthesis protein YabQ [Roseburia porci]|nr:spore cortex biosynthesis protein YabQ [Roseburia porci]MCI5517497.1 spore cortex biosynthesis protein YabQ [Roseburia sp.]MDD6743160.1 spore cortex biosynthesis protein YabQ [Roseburia porci]
MMSVSGSIQNEMMLFGSAVLLGAALMLLYDVIRICRRILPRGIILVSIEDVIYWIVFGIAVFILLYRENDGAVRGFIVGGIAVGLFLYYQLLGRWLMKWMGVLIRSLKKRLKKAMEKVKIKLIKR